MDRQRSKTFTRQALILSNVVCLAAAVSGFILGFSRQQVLHSVGVTGAHVSMFSLCLALVAILGLLAGIVNHLHLLLVYASIIFSSIILRIIWSMTAHIHNSVFILDCTASATLLSTVVSFFLILFAALLATADRPETTNNRLLGQSPTKSLTIDKSSRLLSMSPSSISNQSNQSNQSTTQSHAKKTLISSPVMATITKSQHRAALPTIGSANRGQHVGRANDRLPLKSSLKSSSSSSTPRARSPFSSVIVDESSVARHSLTHSITHTTTTHSLQQQQQHYIA
ncbi:hypothetical protein GZH46_02888 [Fragariocoptes setiger]|uniref:Uncharacterized protein n=1 Tax=Fragariocoptes setiger TaxID=1670756 RepID=A0ABQ7S5A2_9ACAR|nr:hypothetical protein GZH46_02888 [Fragariocoptes setiger]